MGATRVEALSANSGHERVTSRSALLHRQVIILLLLLGCSLRVWAYVRPTSLYLDEILLARNILDLPLGDLLFKPLMLDQVAPRGFLLIERLAVVILGPSEMALRLLPFACAIATILLFWRLTERILTEMASAIALFLFAIGVPFIRFGAEVKQYECDLLAAILLPLLLLKLWQEPTSTRRLLITGLAGFLVVWFSQASVLVMVGLGAAILLEGLISRDGRAKRILLTTISLWAGASLLAIVAGLRSMTPSTKQFMNEFWTGAFLPLPFHWRSGLAWIGQRFTELFSDPTLLRYRWPLIFILLALIGIAVTWARKRIVAFVLCGPPLVALAAAVAHQYPWRGRLAFWMLPGAVIAVATGLEWIRGKGGALHPALGAILLIAVLSIPLTAVAEAPPPYELEHHWQMLSYLQQHRRPGDLIYVAQLQQVGTHFYGLRYGLQPNDWITGVCDPSDARAYLRDVDRFRGVQRLWVLIGSGRPLRAVHASIRDYLATIGIRRDVKAFPSMTLGYVTIELYDLSDSTRWASTNTEKFPVPPMPRDPKIGCRAWTAPGFDWGLNK